MQRAQVCFLVREPRSHMCTVQQKKIYIYIYICTHTQRTFPSPPEFPRAPSESTPPSHTQLLKTCLRPSLPLPVCRVHGPWGILSCLYEPGCHLPPGTTRVGHPSVSPAACWGGTLHRTNRPLLVYPFVRRRISWLFPVWGNY